LHNIRIKLEIPKILDILKFPFIQCPADFVELVYANIYVMHIVLEQG